MIGTLLSDDDDDEDDDEIHEHNVISWDMNPNSVWAGKSLS